MDTKAKLRSDYRRTWEAFSRHMKAVHQLTSSEAPGALEAATREADLAFATHQAARDKLAALLAQSMAQGSANQIKARSAAEACATAA